MEFPPAYGFLILMPMLILRFRDENKRLECKRQAPLPSLVLEFYISSANSKESNTLFWSPQVLHTCNVHTNRYAYIHINLKN